MQLDTQMELMEVLVETEATVVMAQVEPMEAKVDTSKLLYKKLIWICCSCWGLSLSQEVLVESQVGMGMEEKEAEVVVEEVHIRTQQLVLQLTETQTETLRLNITLTGTQIQVVSMDPLETQAMMAMLISTAVEMDRMAAINSL